jgi:hypothetical protein
VRFWWLAALLIFISAVVIGGNRLAEWLSEKNLIENGTLVAATAFDTSGGAKLKDRPLPWDTPLEVDFEWNGKPIEVRGPLSNTGTRYVSGAPIELRVDPDNPEVFTNRTEPDPLGGKLIGAVILLIAAVASILVALVLRQTWLRLWKWGILREAKVREHGHVAVAPRSVNVRCQMRIGKREVLAMVYIPQSANVPAVGAMFPVITNESGSSVLAVQNYHS